MAMNKSDAIDDAKAAFIAAMKGQYGGADADYEDAADKIVAPIVDVVIQHILDNATAGGDPVL